MTSCATDAPAVLGSVEPRLWTPPLRPLTPATSYGFDAIAFGRDVVRRPLDPWQQWAAIHAGELLPDGRPRFRIVLILVARQNGKTELLVVLTLYWQFAEAQPLILGTSTKLDYAKESWVKAVKLANRTPALSALRDPRWTRQTNGEQESWTRETLDEDTGQIITPESRYKIAASNEEGGRSLTINRLILDELRQHHSYAAWDAAEPAASPMDAQIWALTNAGDDRSTVLNDLRESAITYIRTGKGDPRLGLFEWSAPENSDPCDVTALAAANPNLGRRKDVDALLGAAGRAVELGGQALSGFKTEQMCIRVHHVDPAVDADAWARCLDVGDLADVRTRVACCVDLSPDGAHATLAAAAMLDDGRVRVEVVAAWTGAGCTQALRRDLAGHLARIRPQVLGWLPGGPAAAVAADLADRRKTGRRGWPPPGIAVAEIRGETSAVCMGLAEQVNAGQVAHSADPLLDDHVRGAEKKRRGEGWVFSRAGAGHVDAVYASAGAVHLARTLPPQVGRPRLLVAR